MILKYQGSQATDGGSTLTVKIYKAVHTGGVTTVRLMESGAQVMPTGPGERDVYEPLLPATAEVYVWDPSGTLDDELADAEGEEYKVVIEDDGEAEPVIFSGYVIPSPDKRSLNLFPDVTTLLARCTLADMKDIPFVEDSGELYTGRKSIKDILCLILAKTGLGLDVYLTSDWFIPGIAATDDPLSEYHLPMAAFRTEDGWPLSCEEVLKDLSTDFHIQVKQSNGAWHAAQRECLNGSYRRFRYNSAGVLQGSAMYDPGVAVSEAVASQLRTVTDRQPNKLAYRATSVVFNHGPIPPLIQNGDFGTPVRSRERDVYRGAYPPRGTPGDGTRRGTSSGHGSSGGRNSGRGFGGLYDPQTQAQRVAQYWLDQDDLPDVDVEPGAGLDGTNAAVLEPLLCEASEGVNFDNVTEYIWQRGLRFNGGTGRQVRLDLATFLKSDGNRKVRSHLFPVYFDVILNNGTSDQYWLTSDETWSASEAHILFGERKGVARVGITADVWHGYGLHSGDVPAGLWYLKIILYQAFDNAYHLPSVLEKHLWSSVHVELVIGDSIAPSASTVTAFNASTTNKLTRTIGVRFGDAPIVGMMTALTLEDETPTGNWKRGAYSGGADTGTTHTEMLARELFLEQAENVGVHAAAYLREFPRVWPHQVLVLEGVRYQVGDQTYSLARSRQGGSFVQLRQFGTAPTINLLEEKEAAFGSIGGGFGDAATQAAIAHSNELFNRALQNPLAITTAVIAPDATEAVPETVSSIPVAELLSPIEATDGLLLIAPNGLWFELTADENRAIGATTVAITDHAFTEPLPFPAGIYPRTAEIKSLLIQTRDAFRVSIKAGAVGEVNGALSGSVTAIPIKAPGTRFALKHGDRILVQHGTSGAATEAVVKADTLPDDLLAAGATSIPLQSSTALSAPDGSPVHLADVTLQSDIIQQAGEIALKVSKGEVISEINVSPEVIQIASNRIQIDGSTTFAAGYDPTDKNNTFRQATAPASGMTTGDLWIDSDDGDRIYTWNGSAWVEALTIINGGNIQTGTVTASKLSVATLSAITANLGTVTAGIIQDTNGKFVINLASALLTVKDDQGTPVDRVKAGKLGAGAQDYGIEIYSSAGALIVGLTGLGVNTVGTGQIIDGAVLSTKIVDLAITEGKLADLAISLAKLQDSAVGSTKIATGAVITSKLAAGAVTANEIAAGAITALKIAAGAIETDKLAAGAVTAAKISVGTLSAITADLGTVNAGTLNSVVINSPTINAGGGDVTIDDDGVSIVAGISVGNKLRWLNGGTEVLTLYGHSAGTSFITASGALTIESATSLTLLGSGGFSAVIDNTFKVAAGLPFALGERSSNPFGLGGYGQVFVKSNQLHFMRPDGSYGGVII